MRLTNYIRGMIRDNVLAELPKQHSLNYYQDKVKPLVEKDAYNQLPDAVKRVWDDTLTRPFISVMYFSVGMLNLSIYIPTKIMQGGSYGRFIPSSKVQEEINFYIAEWAESSKKRSEATNKLMTALNSCQTLKTLKERYPELTRFLPNVCSPAAKNTQLPVVQNILGDFKSLGLSMSSVEAGE